MDFLKELNGSRKYTFHSHTEFCDGRAQMEAFAREAVAQGFTHYGFSPHSPIPIASSCNMRNSNLPRYLSEFNRICKEYGDRCHFYASMEVDYLGADWGPALTTFQELPLDYIIGSVHFIPNREGKMVDVDGRFESFKRKMHDYFEDDIRYVCETFYAQSNEMIDAGGFDIIGHLDKIGQNANYFQPGIEDEPWYRVLVDNLVSHIISYNESNRQRPITVEINTKAYAEHSGRLFPHPRHWQRLRQANVPMIVNSDAHVPALINASRDIAFSILDSL